MSFPFNFLGRVLKRSGIEAGGGGRRWQGAPMLAAPQQSALAARGPAKARAAGLFLNSPYGQRIVEAWVTALVGKGWQVRAGHSDKGEARNLNDAFEALANPLLVPVARAIVRDGEAFLRIVPGDRGEVHIRQIAADQVDPTISRDLGHGARIVAGIEFDASDRVVAYHVLRDAPGNTFAVFTDAVRIPATDILHIFDPLFPGQVRGLSWLAPILLKLRDRDEASDAMLMALKVQSLVTGFIRDPEGGSAGFGDDRSSTVSGALNLALEPGAMRILPPGSDVTFSKPGDGLAQAVDFLRAQDREIAAGVGLTFEQLTGDPGEANYSSARVGLLEFRRRAEMLQKNLIEAQFLRPLWVRWIDIRALGGSIPADATEFQRVRFVPPGWQWVDPQNEVQAEVAAIQAGLKSREEVVAGRGRDIDDLDEEIARDAARAPKGETE